MSTSEIPDARDMLPSGAIEPNGLEYIVTINGNVFVALTLAEAEAIVNRIRARRHDASRNPRASATTQQCPK